MTHSESIKELATALACAQGEIRNALKTSKNDYHRSHYADLAEVWDSCRAALSKHGLAVVQTTDFLPDFPLLVVVDTTLVHASGEWMAGRLCVLPTKATDKTNDSQATGSAITYCRRYALAAMVGVATDDDDGNAASGKDPKVSDAAAKVAAAAASVPSSRPTKARPAPTPAAERTEPAPPADERGAQPHGSDNAVHRATYYMRAKACGLTDDEAGALAKAVTGRLSSKDFIAGDWDKAFGQIDMRDRWLAFAKSRGFEGEDARNWARDIGFPWDQPWSPVAFQAKYAAAMAKE